MAGCFVKCRNCALPPCMKENPRQCLKRDIFLCKVQRNDSLFDHDWRQLTSFEKRTRAPQRKHRGVIWLQNNVWAERRPNILFKKIRYINLCVWISNKVLLPILIILNWCNPFGKKGRIKEHLLGFQIAALNNSVSVLWWAPLWRLLQQWGLVAATRLLAVKETRSDELCREGSLSAWQSETSLEKIVREVRVNAAITNPLPFLPGDHQGHGLPLKSPHTPPSRTQTLSRL